MKKGSDRTREKILRAAEQLFGQKGFYNTSVMEIAQKAGVGYGTFYLYFKSKDDIYKELVRYLNHMLRYTIHKEISRLESRKEMEKAGFAAFFKFVHRHPHLYRIVLESDEVNKRIGKWYYKKIAERYQQGLEMAMKKGEIREGDPKMIAYCLMGVAHMIGNYCVFYEEREPTEKEFETVMQFILYGLVGH
ncbi:MAG: TetR/AcrR family transcriptional regulator [Nitrososphaerota archaeon]